MKQAWLWALLVMGLFSACDRGDEVARVGGTSITRADVLAYSQNHRSVTPEAALDALISRELLAEGARQQELEKTPAVSARLATARREILANALLDRATAEAVTPKALRARYDAEKDKLQVQQVHVAQLTVRLAPSATASEKTAAHAKINALYARLRTGASFEALAKEASEDPVSAARGGDVGPLREGQVDPQFFEKVAALKKGQYTEPFQTRFGLHLAQALEDPSVVLPPFEQVRGRLAAEARLEVRQGLQKKLAAEITVTRHPERLAAAVDGGSR